MLQSIGITMSLNDSYLGPSSRATPTLTEITFRPHSAHYSSFTATIQDGCDGRRVSLAQLARLIANTGHVGKIDDFTIKPIKQYSYLLSSFSRHISFRPSFGGATLSTIGIKEGKPWKWIFKKFLGRTPAAVCTRWTIVQHRVK
jgi:hypothetical protein